MAGRWRARRDKRFERSKSSNRSLDLFEAHAALDRVAASMGLQAESVGKINYVYVQRKAEATYPTREDYFAVGPSVVETKARYGLPRFEEQWSASQGCLF